MTSDTPGTSRPLDGLRALDLAAACDVVVENFRPGVLDRFGVGWPALSAVNPRLVMLHLRVRPGRSRGRTACLRAHHPRRSRPHQAPGRYQRRPARRHRVRAGRRAGRAARHDRDPGGAAAARPHQDRSAHQNAIWRRRSSPVRRSGIPATSWPPRPWLSAAPSSR